MPTRGFIAVIGTACLLTAVLVSFARAGKQEGQARPHPTPEPTPRLNNGAPIGRLNFPTLTKEQQAAAKALKAGDPMPFRTERDYLILRAGGFRVPRGDYFVRPLIDRDGGYTYFIFCKKPATKPSDVDIDKAVAKDGSFAEILEIAAPVQFAVPFDETRAYTSSSGESGAVWFHFKGQKIEYRGELMGYAGPKAGLVKTQ